MGRWARWAAVLIAVGALCAVPALVAALPAGAARVAPAELIARIRASAVVGYSGLAESRGALGLPSLPRLGSVADLLSGSTRLRVWYAGPQRLRVDQLSAIGETDTYRDGGLGWRWESADRDAVRVLGTATLRLPQPADLLPPELGRRLTADAASARVQALPARRIGGLAAAGVRIVPLGGTTVGRIDVWADPRTGLPVQVEVAARGQAQPALSTRFLEVRVGAPPAARTRFAPPPDARFRVEQVPDLVAAIDRYAPYRLPDRLAGLVQRPRVSGAGGGAATYGDGYGVLAVVPLRSDFAASLVGQLLGPAAGVPVGTARVAPLHTALVEGLVVAAAPGFLLAGTVPAATLTRAALELTRANLPLRSG